MHEILPTGPSQRKAEGTAMTAVPSVGAADVSSARRPSPRGHPRERRCYACGHGLGMMFRNTSKKFEELPPGLV